MGKKTRKKKGRGYKLIGIFFMLCSIALLGIVLYIDILPIKYLSALVGGLLFLNIIINFFLFRRTVKKKPKRFFAVIAILLSIVFLAASFFIYKTFAVVEEMSQKYKIYTYHVVVKDDSDYQNIEDVSGKSLGYYNNNSTATKAAISKLSEKVTTENEGFGNLDSLGDSILKEKKDSILLEESQKIKLDNAGKSSESMVFGFADKTRIIYTFKVKVKIESKDVDVTKDVFNIYISGMDEYGKVRETSRSDVNILVTINPKTKQILLTNIPRDYYVRLHDTTGYKDKLTHAGIYGIDTSVATIEDLLGVDINYYFKVNFSSLVDIIDALGGVDVYSEYDFQTWNGYNFSKGYNSVDGKAGLSFVRERKQFMDGDNQRGKNQQAMIEAIFRKCTSPSVIPRYNSLLNSLKDSMITNMPMNSITKLAKMQLKDNAKWTITSNSLTGTGSSDYTYSYPSQALYVTVPDEESIESSKKLIEKVNSGEKLESSYDGDASDVHSVSKSAVSKQSSYVAPSSSKKTTTTKKFTTKSSTNSTTKSSAKTNKQKSSSSSSTTPSVKPDTNTNTTDNDSGQTNQPSNDSGDTGNNDSTESDNSSQNE